MLKDSAFVPTVASTIGAAALMVAFHALIVSWESKRVNEQGNAATNRPQDDAVVVTLPAWANDFMDAHKDVVFTSEEQMMEVAIALADKNVAEKTGGPFGTAIFECDTQTGSCKLFSIGMNQVATLHNSTLHGEMTAIQFGQKKLNSFTFGANKSLGKEYHLYTSCEPCCQCLGGTLWSGVSKLVCAASKEDAEAIGFDEGPVFAESYAALEKAGVKVVRNCLRQQGAKTLKLYGETGLIYNA
ncbi:cytidine deaminase-like protein [Nitzschia inconspicua]|uniref:Cytidine deaminase-like protein n=1 Tax=Nitzschia inconspicua TaxID=303405 RepID=A0A9K3KX44_9STRA|nr:cytidine deaminase-like protein [Nitzschia inconspicua]